MSHLDDIARYFSQLPAPPAIPLPNDVPSQTFYQKGAVLFHKGRDDLAACVTCHGVQAEHLSFSPWLDAQHRDYLVKQLRDFKQGRRQNDQDAVMRSIATKLTGDDIEALARYLASTTMRPRAK
jgi:cytochrome c553